MKGTHKPKAEDKVPVVAGTSSKPVVHNGEGKISAIRNWYKWAMFIVFVAVLVLSMMAIILQHFYHEDRAEVTESDLVLQFTELLRQTGEDWAKLNSALKEDPAADLIINQLRPIQDRVTSISTTVRNVGENWFPENFVGDTIRELQTLSSLAFELDKELFPIVFTLEQRKRFYIIHAQETERAKLEFYKMSDGSGSVPVMLLSEMGVPLLPSPLYDRNSHDVESFSQDPSFRIFGTTAFEAAALYEEIGLLLKEKDEALERTELACGKGRNKLPKTLENNLGKSLKSLCLGDLELQRQPEAQRLILLYNNAHLKLDKLIMARKETLQNMPEWLHRAKALTDLLIKKTNESISRNAESVLNFLEERNAVIENIADLRQHMKSFVTSFPRKVRI